MSIPNIVPDFARSFILNRFPNCGLVSPKAVSESDVISKSSTYIAVNSIDGVVWWTYQHMSAVFLVMSRSPQESVSISLLY